jgi:hypothetical protein
MIRTIICLSLFILFVAFSGGCAPSQDKIEESIREEMKKNLSVNITSFDLKKQSDGSYVGTATADNGDVYDVTTRPPEGNKIEWRAYPSQLMLEKKFREEIESMPGSKVKSLTLTKQEGIKYTGTAELENGLKFNLRAELEGTQVMTYIEPAKD